MSFRYERNGPLGVLRLDKARGNAIDDRMLADLKAWAQEAVRDEGLRGLLLASAHPKVFCPGLDLVSLVDRDRDAMRDFMSRFADTLWALYGMLKPVVAAVGGHAVAGGCILALTADHRVLARSGAQIGLNEVRLGVPLPWSVVILVRSTVPPASLSRVALLGRNFTGEEALQAGLVDALADPAEVEPVALARLEEFAEKDPLAFGATKGWLRSQSVAAMKAHETETMEIFLDAWFSPATRERLRQTVEGLKKA